MPYLILGLLWILWCVLHSAMISIRATLFLKRRFGGRFRFYRLFYNFTALFTLLPLIYYTDTLKGPVLFEWEGIFMAVRVILLPVSILLFWSGGRAYDLLHFAGFRQIMTGRTNAVMSPKGDMNITGVMKSTRHPWYLGGIIFIWVNYKTLYGSTLIANMILTVYFFVGTFLEERKLVAELGRSYEDYQKEVSMLFPFKWLKARFKTKS